MNNLLSITRQDPMQILHQEELRKFSFHLPFLPSGSLTNPPTLLVDPHPQPPRPAGSVPLPWENHGSLLGWATRSSGDRVIPTERELRLHGTSITCVN